MSTAGAQRQHWRVLARAARQRGNGLAWVVLALVLSTALPLASPLALRRFIDQASAGAPVGRIARTGVVFLALAVTTQIGVVIATYAGSRWAWRTTNRLREDLFVHTLSLDYAFHGRHTPGEMIERVDGDVVGLGEFLSQVAVQAAASALLLVGALVLVTLEDVRLGAAFLAMIVLGGIGLLRGQRTVVPYAAAEREMFAQMYGGIEEHLAGAEDIRANGAGEHAVMRFHQSAARTFRATFAWQSRSGLLLAVTSSVFTLGTVGLLALGVALHSRGALTLGAVVALFQYSQLVQRPVEQLISQSRQLQHAAASAGRVADLLGETPMITDVPTPTPLPDGPLSVALRGVTFEYADDPPVLHDVDLFVAAGRSLGLIGRSGSGKSTIGRLVLRFYDLAGGQGTIEIGGVDVRDTATADLRTRARAVTQDVQVFNASVYENVTLFDGTVASARVEDVLREVGLGSWLDGLPDGTATALGTGSFGMSAGEAQLLALARLFLADPAVVVLDEPSSRLDPDTERLVEAATARLMVGRTCIVIAHRLAALTHVDEVAVLEAGRVVERGRFATLEADPGSRLRQLLAPEATS